MAATAALGVVKQIQALADGPPTPEMKDCLGQVVASLLFFLDHPDSRVRINAARTLLKLSSGYQENIGSLDLSRARSALKRCEEAQAEGTNDQSSEELREILASFLDAANNGSRPSNAPAASSKPVQAQDTDGSEKRGQVVLKVSEQADGKIRAAMLDKVVALDGVVSVTFEGQFVIVSTRSPTVAADASFLADLLSAVKAQGIQGVSLVSAAGAAGAESSSSSGAASSAEASATAPAEPKPAVIEEEVAVDDEAEPAYLDDEEDEEAEPGGASASQPAPAPSAGSGANAGGYPGAAGAPPLVGFGGAPAWTFFSQHQWMNGRRVLEFDDDPAIASRLARKKKQEADKREAEKTRLGRLSSWLTGK